MPTAAWQKIIDSAAKDIEALQTGGVDAVMFGNEGDRPYVLKASPVTLAAFAFAVGELKRSIKVPFGVNYLWDPVASVALGVAVGRALRPRDLHRRLRFRHGTVGSRCCGRAAAPRQYPPGRHEADVQHQCRVRVAGRDAHAGAAGQERGLRLARRRRPRLRADDRRGGGGLQPQGSEGSAVPRSRRSSPTPASTSTMSRRSSRSATAQSSARISRSTATPGTRSTATG